jgi:hypothetical protein
MTHTTRNQLKTMTAEVARRDALIASWAVVATTVTKGAGTPLHLEANVLGLYPDRYTFQYTDTESTTLVRFAKDRTERGAVYTLDVRDVEGLWVATHTAVVLDTADPYCLLAAEPHDYPPPAGAPAQHPTASAELLAALRD